MYIALTLQAYNSNFLLQLKQIPTGMSPVGVLKEFGNFPRKYLKWSHFIKVTGLLSTILAKNCGKMIAVWGIMIYLSAPPVSMLCWASAGSQNFQKSRLS